MQEYKLLDITQKELIGLAPGKRAQFLTEKYETAKDKTSSPTILLNEAYELLISLDALEIDPLAFAELSLDQQTEQYRAQYKKLALRYHPDRHEGENKELAEAKFKVVTNAHDYFEKVYIPRKEAEKNIDKEPFTNSEQQKRALRELVTKCNQELLEEFNRRSRDTTEIFLRQSPYSTQANLNVQIIGHFINEMPHSFLKKNYPQVYTQLGLDQDNKIITVGDIKNLLKNSLLAPKQPKETPSEVSEGAVVLFESGLEPEPTHHVMHDAVIEEHVTEKSQKAQDLVDQFKEDYGDDIKPDAFNLDIEVRDEKIIFTFNGIQNKSSHAYRLYSFLQEDYINNALLLSHIQFASSSDTNTITVDLDAMPAFQDLIDSKMEDVYTFLDQEILKGKKTVDFESECKAQLNKFTNNKITNFYITNEGKLRIEGKKQNFNVLKNELAEYLQFNVSVGDIPSPFIEINNNQIYSFAEFCAQKNEQFQMEVKTAHTGEPTQSLSEELARQTTRTSTGKEKDRTSERSSMDDQQRAEAKTFKFEKRSEALAATQKDQVEKSRSSTAKVFVKLQSTLTVSPVSSVSSEEEQTEDLLSEVLNVNNQTTDLIEEKTSLFDKIIGWLKSAYEALEKALGAGMPMMRTVFPTSPRS